MGEMRDVLIEEHPSIVALGNGACRVATWRSSRRSPLSPAGSATTARRVPLQARRNARHPALPAAPRWGSARPSSGRARPGRTRRPHRATAAPAPGFGQVEPPRRAEGERVIDPPRRRVPQRLGVALRQQRPDPGVGHHPPVSLWQLGPERRDVAHGIGLDLGGGQPSSSISDCGAAAAVVNSRILDSAIPASSQALRTPAGLWRPAPRPGSPGPAASRHTRARAARRRIARSPRTAYVQIVGDCQDIGGHVRHQPGRHAVRAAVPGAVETDQLYPEFVKHPPARERPHRSPVFRASRSPDARPDSRKRAQQVVGRRPPEQKWSLRRYAVPQVTASEQCR